MYKTVLNKQDVKEHETNSLQLIAESILTSRLTLTAHFLTPIFISYKDYDAIGFVNSYLQDLIYQEEHDSPDSYKLHVVINLKKAVLYPNIIHAKMLTSSYYEYDYMISDTHCIYVFGIPEKLVDIFLDGKYSLLPYERYSRLSDARAIIKKNSKFLDNMLKADYFDEGLVELILRNDAEFWSKPDIEKEKLTTYDIFRI